jgi:hypothetical protein
MYYFNILFMYFDQDDDFCDEYFYVDLRECIKMIDYQ